MAQQIKVLAIKSNNLNWIPRAHKMEKRVYYIKKVVLESTNEQDLKLCVCYLFIYCVLHIYNKLKFSG